MSIGFSAPLKSRGGQGGDREKRGLEVYGRQEMGGGRREKKGKNCATLCNILQSKMQRGGSQQIQGGNWD